MKMLKMLLGGAWVNPKKNWKWILAEVVIVAAVVFCVMTLNKKVAAPVLKPAAAVVQEAPAAPAVADSLAKPAK